MCCSELLDFSLSQISGKCSSIKTSIKLASLEISGHHNPLLLGLLEPFQLMVAQIAMKLFQVNLMTLAFGTVPSPHAKFKTYTIAKLII